jgi:hypothetical protein
MDEADEETKEEPHWELDDKARALAKQQEIAEREADEQRKQRELIDAYAHSVARDAANDGKDDWSELRSDEVVEEATISLSSYLFGSSTTSVPESPRDQLIRDAILDENTIVDDDERERQESALRHWKNYDLATSLKPQLVPEREYLAALKICRACRIFNQRREAARRQQSVGNIAICSREATKIKRAWRGGKGRRAMRDAKQASFEDEKDWKSYEDFRATLLGPGYTLSRWSHSKKALVPCNITVSKDRDWLLMKQPNRKTKKRRLKDIHTIAKGYKSPFLRDLLHQPKEDLVLTLMLRRIKVLPLGLGEEVVEDSLDFLFEVPASMRPRRRPRVASTASAPSLAHTHIPHPRRWRLHETVSPRRRRCGLARVSWGSRVSQRCPTRLKIGRETTPGLVWWTRSTTTT